MKDDMQLQHTANRSNDVASAWIVGAVSILCLLLVSTLREEPLDGAAPGIASGIQAENSIGTVIPATQNDK